MPLPAIDIFPWNDHFNTGLPEVDAQHHQLVQLLNRLACQVAAPGDPGLLRQVCDELTAYALHHFETEEAIWRTYLAADPAEVEHRATHQAFVHEVQRLQALQATQPLAAVMEQALGFLLRWLTAHILEGDRYLAFVVQARQQGLALDAAKQQAQARMRGATRTLNEIILSAHAALSANSLALMRELAEHRADRDALQRARQNLQASETNFRSFFDTLSDFLFVLDMQGNILRANRTALVRLGYAETELLGQSILKVHPPDRHEEALRIVAGMLEGTLATCPIPLQAVDGQQIPVETRVVPGQWNGAAALFGFSRDISERQRQEAQRDEALALLNAAIEQSPSGIVIADVADGRIRYANQVALAIRGGDHALLTDIALEQHTARWDIARLDGTAYPPDELPLTRAMRQGVVTAGEEVIIRDVDGKPHWVAVNAAPIRRDDEVVAGIVILQDVTKRKAIQRQLEASEQRLRIAMGAAHMGVWEFHFAENRLYWSPELIAMFGLGAVEPSRALLESIEHEDDRGVSDAAMQHAIATRSNYFAQYRIRVGPQIRWVEDFAAIHFAPSGAPERAIGIARDITEHKVTEDRLRSQLDELRRWQDVTLDREERILALKAEVNALRARLNEPARYASVLNG